MSRNSKEAQLPQRFQKFPGIPAGNFGGPRFPGIPEREFPVALTEGRTDRWPLAIARANIAVIITDFTERQNLVERVEICGDFYFHVFVFVDLPVLVYVY